MIPIENTMDYSVSGTASGIVSIMQLNMTRALPEPYRDDINPDEWE